LTLLFRSYKIALIVCLLCSALLAGSAKKISEMYGSVAEAKKYQENAKEIEQLDMDYHKILVDISKMKLKSNLLNDEEKKVEEGIIKANQNNMQEVKKDDSSSNENSLDKYKKSKADMDKLEIWVKLMHINPVIQGVYYSEWKENDFVYTADDKKMDKKEADKLLGKTSDGNKDATSKKLEQLVISEENMASTDTDAYTLYKEQNGKLPEENENFTQDQEKVKKRYLEIENKLFKDQSYKKLIEKKFENEDKRGNIYLKKYYKPFDIKTTLATNIICCIAFLFVSCIVFSKKNLV